MTTSARYIDSLHAEARQRQMENEMQYIEFLEARAAQEARLAQKYKAQRNASLAAGIAAGLIALLYITRRHA